MEITRIDPPCKGEVSTYFIAGDWHSDHLHTASLEILVKMARRFPKAKRKLIINGDFLDCPHLMPRNPMYKTWIKKADGVEEFFLPESEKELEWGNGILDLLQNIFSEIIYIEGNHDWRYRDFMKICPSAYAHNFDYRIQLRLMERGIKTVDYNNWLDMGDKLSVTHGMYHGSTCLKKHYEASGGKSVIFSHVHRAECKAFTVRGDSTQVWSLPAMCTLNPIYMKNIENNWSNGFGMIHLKDDSTFNFNTYQVWNNQLVDSNGKIIQGS